MEYVRYYTGTWSSWERIQTTEKAIVKHDTNISIANTSYNVLPFSSIEMNTSAFELTETGGIKCNKAGDYFINANLCIGGSTLVQNDRLILAIAKNDTNDFNIQQDANGAQQLISLSGYLIHLSKNDVLTLKYRNLTGARGTVVSSQCYMSISS